MTIGKGAVTVETEDDHCTDDECRCVTLQSIVRGR